MAKKQQEKALYAVRVSVWDSHVDTNTGKVDGWTLPETLNVLAASAEEAMEKAKAYQLAAFKSDPEITAARMESVDQLHMIDVL